MRKTRSSRCISSLNAWLSASLYVSVAIQIRGRGHAWGMGHGAWGLRLGGLGACAMRYESAGFPVTPCPVPHALLAPCPVPHALSARLHQHVFVQRLKRRLGTLLREVPRVLHLRLQLLVEFRHSGVVDLAGFLHLHPEDHDRVALHVFLQLGLRAVRA